MMDSWIVGCETDVHSGALTTACALLSQQQSRSSPFTPTASARYYFSDVKERRNSLREGNLRCASEVSLPILIMFTVFSR